MKRRHPHFAICALISLFSLTCFFGYAESARDVGEALEGFDAFVESVMKEWEIPGIAVAIVADGEPVHVRGYGYRDVESGKAVTGRTLFAIGSNSKSFTVSLLGMLNDDKKVEWDRPLREYLPDFRMYDPRATAEMTPRDLVTHRSGLPRHDLLWYASGLSRKELFDRLRYLEPTRPFRSYYQYQNLMFMTAGYLAERLTEDSWENLVRKRVFTPLRMDRSNFSVTAMQRDADFSYPYQKESDEVVRVPFRNIDAVGPAGSINSSAEEMAQYILFHLNHGKVGDKQVLSERNSREMQRPQMFITSPISPSAIEIEKEVGDGSYGLGLAVGRYRGHKLVQHGGGIDGFISAMGWLPHDGIGVMVLSNFSGVNPVPSLVARNAYDRMLGLEPFDWVQRTRDQRKQAEERQAKAREKAETEHHKNTQPSHKLEDYAGTYEHPAYGKAVVKMNGSGLLVSVVGFDAPVEHHHYDVFQVPRDLVGSEGGLAGLQVQFYYDKKGNIDRLAIPLEPALSDMVFKRKESEQD